MAWAMVTPLSGLAAAKLDVIAGKHEPFSRPLHNWHGRYAAACCHTVPDQPHVPVWQMHDGRERSVSSCMNVVRVPALRMPESGLEEI
jgi:hypothetical protein